MSVYDFRANALILRQLLLRPVCNLVVRHPTMHVEAAQIASCLSGGYVLRHE